MKIRQINLDDFPDYREPGAYPTTVTVEMDMREAVYLSRLLGKLNDHDKEAIVRGASELEIWDPLNGDLFNRFWDDGDMGAVRDLGMLPTPDAAEAARERGKIGWRE